MLGEVYLPISYDKVTVNHTFYVVANTSVNLLGRDLFNAFHFQIVYNPNNDMLVNRVTSEIHDEFSSYFSDNFKSNVRETIKLNVPAEVTPVYCKARKVPVRLRESLKKELDRLVSLGILSKIHSSDWATPIVTVLKNSGNLRLCADFSATLNKYIKPVNCVLPTIDQVISSTGQATVFSKIDLSQAFLQLPIHEDSQQYLVINTPEGLFKFHFLPFGLSSSPGVFQSFMCKVLDNIPGVIVYQDDLLLMSKNNDSHKILVRKVLNTLKDAGLKLNYEKCSFFTDKIDYLGHIFDATGVHPNPNKIAAILKAPVPVCIKQVQSFIGLCNFYSRFIPNFADHMAPLYALLNKNSSFTWTDAHTQTFEYIKKLFVSRNILRHFNPDHETSIETDASSYGIGAVLLQRSSKYDYWSPVQFASRTLNSAERNYSQIEREGLSVIFALDRFREFLLGCSFLIFNDHKPLFTLFAKDKPEHDSCSPRIQRWALKLSQFNYNFVYSKGSNNIHSDFLSRLPLPVTVTEVEPYELIFALESIENEYVNQSMVRDFTNRDKNVGNIY